MFSLGGGQKCVAWQDHQQRLGCIESYAWRRFTNWLTSSRWQDNALTPVRDQWQNCPYNYKTLQKLINFFSLRVANLEVMIVESVRHTRARAGRVETSSFPGFFLFLSREVMCRSFRSFSIPSRNPRHLIFWRLVWSISEQTGLNAPPNLFFVKDKISDHQKPMTWSNGLVRQWHFTLWPILKT